MDLLRSLGGYFSSLEATETGTELLEHGVCVCGV